MNRSLTAFSLGIALLAAVWGCSTKTETLSSGGADGDGPVASNTPASIDDPSSEGTTTSGQSPVESETAAGDPAKPGAKGEAIRQDKAKPTPKNPIAGTWVGKLDVGPPAKGAKSGDPGEEMGRAMAAAMTDLFTFELQLGEADDFRFSMMGIPVEGTYTRKGETLTLTSKTIGGMPPEEFEKKMKSAGPNPMAKNIEDFKEPMKLQVKGSKLILNDSGKEDGNLVFTRKVQKAVKNKLKSPAEKAVAGKYKGEIDESVIPAEQRQMAEMFTDMIYLDLLQDKTFELSMVIKFTGTWSISGNKLTLKPDSAMGVAAAGESETMDFTVSKDSKTLTALSKKPQEKITFRRQ